MLAAPTVMVTNDLQMALNEWYAGLQASRRSPYTIVHYRQQWSLFIRRCQLVSLDQVTAITVRGYLGQLSAEGKSAGTVHIAFRAIRAFVGWCLDEKIPVEASLLGGRQGRRWFRVQAPRLDYKAPEILTAGQIDAVEKALVGWPLLFTRTLLSTGLRLGEALNLELDDFVQMDSTMTPELGDAPAMLRVRTSKNHRARFVPVSSRLNRDLLRYTRQRKSGRLFVISTGKPVGANTVKTMFSRLSKRVGFRVHAHQMRHTFATHYLQRRPAEAEHLRRVLGHVNQQMLARYVHLGMADMLRDWEEKTLY